MTNLAYIHIGSVLPDYLYSSVYQSLLINGYSSKVYVILSDGLVDEFKRGVSNFNLDYYVKDRCFYQNSVVEVIPLSLLDMWGVNDNNFKNYKDTITNKFGNVSGFRDGFWISTTSRFFYLSIFMEMFGLKELFHIESDIMLYSSLETIENDICVCNQIDSIDKICMVEDAPGRVIPSILYFPNNVSLSNLTQFITNELLSSNVFINDMDILGKWPEKYKFNTDVIHKRLIYDGAALGQFLGGVDYRNILGNIDYNNMSREQELVIYNNPSRGFINETATIKPDELEFTKSKSKFDNLRVPIRIPVSYFGSKISPLANLHVHSKQLYQFSSVFDLSFLDIISGDRILGLCDFVLTTPEIYNFHKNIEKYAKDVILIKRFENINMKLLNSYFRESCKKRDVDYVKIFIYTHMLSDFRKYVFQNLDNSINYVFYLHNSDHSFGDENKELLESSIVKKIYAQNIDTNVDSNKLCLLPIGIANSMWNHGDILKLYKTMSNTYWRRKENSIYVNINPKTYSYRGIVLDKIKSYGMLEISDSRPYDEYLNELSKYRFCLCLRGNGIDTHRFWESLYLGVIPVILNNKTTACDNFTKYMKRLNVPFYEIVGDDLDIVFKKYNSDYFDEDLYKQIITNCNSTVFNSDCLKMSFYEYENGI